VGSRRRASSRSKGRWPSSPAPAEASDAGWRGPRSCGARVLVTDIEAEAIEAVCGTLEEAGVECAGLALDLRDADAPERIVAAAADRLGGLNVLVNNAVTNRRMPILEMDPETFDLIMEVDLRCRTSSPRPRRAG